MKQLLTFIAAISFLSLTAQSPIKIKQIESSEPVMLRYDSIRNCWGAIAIPFEFKVIYSAPNNLWLWGSDYYLTKDFGACNENGSWNTIGLRMRVGDEYVSPRYARYYEIPDTCYYWAGSVHYLQPESDFQDSLDIYVQRIKDAKTSSLPIGTLSEFKAKHPQLVERLLRNDSISFKVYRKQPSKYVDAIKMPIEY